jgi:hypothetical protein
VEAEVCRGVLFCGQFLAGVEERVTWCSNNNNNSYCYKKNYSNNSKNDSYSNR